MAIVAGGNSTTCTGCNRVVWVLDVDKDGKCILCAPPKVKGAKG